MGSEPPPGPPGGGDRLRFRYTKTGRIRFTSHRDVARLWERALRRSGLAVGWSGGFSPRPLLSFGLALPTGAESLGEFLDVRLDQEERVAEAAGPGSGALVGTLDECMPEGLVVQAVGVIGGAAGSLQQDVASCAWDLEVLGVTAAEMTERVERLLGSSSVVIRRERKGRPVDDDLRPAVRTLATIEAGAVGTATRDGACRLRAELATQPRGVRPGELLEGLGADLVLARACRTHQWIERDGARWEPLTTSGQPPGSVAPHASERAS